MGGQGINVKSRMFEISSRKRDVPLPVPGAPIEENKTQKATKDAKNGDTRTTALLPKFL